MKNHAKNLQENIGKVVFAVIESHRLTIMDGTSLDHSYKLDRLAQDIGEASRLLSPLTVVGPYDDGTYFVVDGGRRLLALRDMGINHIPCYIVGGASTTIEQATLLALNANRSQRPSSPSEIVCYAKMISQEAKEGNVNPKTSELILSKGYGISGRLARRYLSFVERSPEKLVDEVINKGLRFHYAEAILRGYEAQIRKQDKKGEDTLQMLIDLFYSPDFKTRNKSNIINLVSDGKIKFKDGKAVVDQIKIASNANIMRARNYVKSVTTSDNVRKADLKPLLKDFRALLRANGISIAEFELLTETDSE